MSHYIYRLFINFLLIHYFIYRLVRWSDPQYIYNCNRFRTSQSRNKFFSENLQITLIHFFSMNALSLLLTVKQSSLPSDSDDMFFLTAAFFLLQDKFHTILHGSEQYRMLYLYPEFFSDLYFLQLSGFLRDDA